MRFYFSFILLIALRTIIAVFGIWREGRSILMRDRYLMFHVGWRGEGRVYGCVIHIEIRSGKIWIQRDGTEVGIANELIESGVAKSDIVLGYRSPYMRKFTELGVG